MGGLAGHMSHLYGDKGLKFSELVSIIKRVASGDLQYNEKADGQNIHVTMDTERNVYFARNMTDFRAVGRSAETVEKDYRDKNFLVQAEIFGDGCRAIEASLKNLPDELVNLVFNDPRMPSTYINCEIIHKKHPNLVVYDKNHIQFHEFKTMSEADYEAKEGLFELNRKFSIFLSSVEGSTASVPAYEGTTKANPSGTVTFTIGGPQFLPAPTQNMTPEKIELFNQQVSQTVGNLLELVNSQGLTDQSTIGDYLVSKIEDEVLPALSIDNSVISDVAHYLVYGTDASGIVITGKRGSGNTLKSFKDKLKNVLGKEMADKLTLGKYKSFQSGLAGAAISPLKEIIHNFSLSIVNAAESIIASDPGLAKFATRQAISDMQSVKQAVIQDYSADPARLERNLAKFERELALLGDIENFSQSMEGVVISYVREDGMPILYKLTGNFAPANQLLGMSARGFEIKRTLLNQAIQEYRSTQYNPTPEDEINPVNENKIRSLIRESIEKVLSNHVNAFKNL